jgi:hypothetical protein
MCMYLAHFEHDYHVSTQFPQASSHISTAPYYTAENLKNSISLIKNFMQKFCP